MAPADSARPLLQRACIAALALVGATGCGATGAIEAGFVTSTTMQAGRQGGAVDLHLAREIEDSLHLNLSARGRITEEDRQLALGVGALLASEPRPVAPYALAGVHFFQAGRTDDAFSYGFGSPYLEAGLLLSPSEPNDPVFLLGTSIEYTLRFTPQPHEAFWAVKLGIAWGTD